MTTKAAIYARISSDRTDERNGVTRQLEDCRALAERHGWEVVREYVDNDSSAWRKNASRPQYDQMVEAYGAGQFTTLVCYDLDRLTRQPRQLEDWIDAAEEHGLHVVTANGEADLRTDAGRLFARIKASVARNEADHMSARIKRAGEAREQAGLYHGGTVPYGYKVDGKRLVPNPPEVERVREAVERLLRGDTVSGIVKDWQRRGVITRKGKIWRVTGLRPILRNPAIIGKNKLGEVKWEPIIDEPSFDRLRSMFEDPTRWTTISPGVKGGRYSLGGGLVVCGECGQSLTSYKREAKRGSRPGLRCARHTGGCGAISIDYTRLEAYVFAYIEEALTSSPRWSLRSAERGSKEEAEIARLDAERATLADKRARVLDAHVDGLIDKADTRARVAQIDARADEIEQRSASLLGASMFDQDVSQGLQMDGWTAERKRNFARLFIERVVVSRWPSDLPTGLPRRRGESEQQHSERFEAGQMEALKRRVAIVPRSE